MRFAFWPAAGKLRDLVEQVVAKAMPVTDKPAVRPAAPSIAGDLDLGAIGRALAHKRRWIIVPTLLAMVLSVIAVNLITPRYKSEVRILIDGREKRVPAGRTGSAPKNARHSIRKRSRARFNCCCRAIWRGK